MLRFILFMHGVVGESYSSTTRALAPGLDERARLLRWTSILLHIGKWRCYGE